MRPRAGRSISSSARPWIIAAGVLLLLLAIWLVIRALTSGAGAPRYITKPVAYADISSTFEETGTVNPAQRASQLNPIEALRHE